MSLGYRKDFDDSWFTNYVAFDQFNLGYSLKPTQRLSLDLLGNVRLEDYRGEVTRNDSTRPARHRLHAHPWMKSGLRALTVAPPVMTRPSAASSLMTTARFSLDMAY